MHSLLPVAVVSSFRRAAKEPLLPVSAVHIRGDEVSSPISLVDFARQVLPPIPWFIEDASGDLATPLSPVFGVFALRAVLRGFYIGASFLSGGDVLLSQEHLAPAVLSYYTSAFHLVTAFNALHGRVLISPVLGQATVEFPADQERTRLPQGGTSSPMGSAGYEAAPKGLKAVCAILARNGSWAFEGRSLSHSTIWRDLKQLVLETHAVPKWLDRFCQRSSYPPIDELLSIEECLEQLIRTRHQAVYMGFGMDDWTFDQLINRERPHGHLAARAENHRELAYGVFDDVLVKTTDLFAYAEKSCPAELQRVLPSVCVMVHIPPFDVGRGLLDAIDWAIGRVPGCAVWVYKMLLEAG